MNTDNIKNTAVPDSEIFTKEDAKLYCAGLIDVDYYYTDIFSQVKEKLGKEK